MSARPGSLAVLTDLEHKDSELANKLAITFHRDPMASSVAEQQRAAAIGNRKCQVC